MNSWRNLEFNKETNIISNFAFIFFILYFTVNWYILKRYMICLDSRDRNGILVVYKSMTPNFNKTRQNPYKWIKSFICFASGGVRIGKQVNETRCILKTLILKISQHFFIVLIFIQRSNIYIL